MDQATSLGVPAEFKFRDRVYKVAARTFEHEALFCQWVKRENLEEIERQKSWMPATLYQMQIDGWRRDLGMKLYDWGMPFIQSASLSPSGSKQLAYLALAEKNPGVTLLLIDAIYDDADAWERLCLVMADLNDPNRPKQVHPEATQAPVNP